MIDTLNTTQAINRLLEDEYAGWSRGGATAIIEYLEQLEDDTGDSLELDVVAIRCDFSEYTNATDCAEEYDEWNNLTDFEGSEEIEERATEWLQEQTTVISFPGGVIVGAF